MQHVASARGRHDEHDRLALVDQRDRTMLELSRGEALGEGVGDLLELQRAFHGDRIPHMTSEEQEGLRVHHLLGGLLHGLGLGVEDPLDFAGHVLQRVQSLGDFVSIHGALDLGQIQAEHVCGGDLRHERLGGGDRHFRTGVGVEHRVGFAWDGRALRVADGQYLGALFTRVAQRHQRVHGLAGLRNGHHQRSGGEDRVTVAEFVGEFHFYRNAHPMLDGVFGHHARVRGRAAGDDDDLVDGFEIMLVDAHLIEVDVAVLVETPQQSALHGGRILMDLLVHEGVPTALFGGGRIPVHGVGLRIGHDVAHEVGDDDLVCGHHHGLVLVDFHGALGVGHERGNVGAKEVLPVAEAHHERRIVTGADHDVRLSHVRGENGERAFQHAGQTADGLEQVRLAGFLDDLVADFAQQFRRDLGIGFGDETIALRLQVETKLGSVFDDAVVDDGDLAVTRRVRMRVSVVRHAVRSPTRMADAHGGVRHRITFDVLHQVGQTSGLLTDGHTLHARRRQRHAGRIISAVFQSLKSLETHLQRLAARGPNISCISYDSTHSSLAYRVRMSIMKPSRASLQIFAIYAKSHSPREIVRTSGTRNAPIVGSKKKTQPTGRLRTLDVSGLGIYGSTTALLATGRAARSP